jgi:3D-(3,5/4)-trihydroxycyclohexane-1,2-dione acylhydrolase (decyclizing)
MGIKITIVLTDNRGYGCINWLQMGTGEAEFNDLFDHSHHAKPSHIDFVGHAASLGAEAVKAGSIAELGAALEQAKRADGPFVVVIDTHPYASTPDGGYWWDVAVPEASEREPVRAESKAYEAELKNRNER